MIRINLLPVKAAQRLNLVKQQAILALVGLALVLAVCAFTFTSIQSDISALTAENAEMESDIERLKKIIGKVEEYKKTKVEVQQKIDVIERLKTDRTGPVHLLDEVANAIDDKAWLTSITEQGEKVNLVGQALNMESIADFTERLRRSEFIAQVEVGPTRRVQGKGLYLQEFLLIAYQKQPPSSEEKGKGDK